MELLAGLYTLLLVTICLLLAVVLWKLNKPRNGGDYEELKRWMQQQLDAQAKDFAARQAAMAEQNYTAIRSVSETLQTSVQSMSTTLAQGQERPAADPDPALPESGGPPTPRSWKSCARPLRKT